METPAVNIDDIFNFNSTISITGTDEMPSDNSFDLLQTVTGAFDPNDKICLNGTTVVPSQIGKYLNYVINFENTGTAAAVNIVVKDEIDGAKFDVASLQVLESSHAMNTKVTGNKVEFIFPNINLAPEAHGRVVFKIKTKNTLVTGNSVTNKADIYFDYNFPVATNNATTTFQNLGIGDVQIDNSIAISPNPVNDVLNIKAAGIIKSVELYDVQGRMLVAKIADTNYSDFDVSAISSGVYFVKIKTSEGVKTERILKK
ncbi:T9SS type A sorting domain-containing protein [Flavobacterium sp. 3HN19-14]|uniref:T9SS type A sorting domain-containing protein n=1 Tax=Flavobacterium sp. 3HN19-14 TaxID=3448133 RepID=UPI003EE24D13